MGNQPVICAFEASPPGRRAVEAAAWLAGALRVPLAVIHVFDPEAQPAEPRDGPFRDPVLRERLAADLDRAARARMDLMLTTLVEPLGIDDVETLVLDGRVVPTLHDSAAQRRALVLVSGTAGRAGVDHVIEGSVARDLAARAPCPVVAVPPDAIVGEPGPVLVGDDGSEHASRAVAHAGALAERLGRPLVRMHARSDDPVQELASAGAEQRACLLAAGTRGRGALRAELLGSVSTGLIQRAERPVMLVPASAG